MKQLKENVSLQQAAIVFDNPNSTHLQVKEAGEKALVTIYGGKQTEGLNKLQYRKYSEKVATSLSQVDPKNLPPTSAAAKFHSYRVFLQVNQQKDTDCDMLPESWGWKNDGGLRPIPTDIAAALDELLRINQCNCTTDCATARCSCQKHGMNCSVACGQC